MKCCQALNAPYKAKIREMSMPTIDVIRESKIVTFGLRNANTISTLTCPPCLRSQGAARKVRATIIY